MLEDETVMQSGMLLALPVVWDVTGPAQLRPALTSVVSSDFTQKGNPVSSPSPSLVLVLFLMSARTKLSER